MMMLKSGRILHSSSLDDVRPGLVDDREFHRVDSRIGSDFHDNQLAPSGRVSVRAPDDRSFRRDDAQIEGSFLANQRVSNVPVAGQTPDDRSFHRDDSQVEGSFMESPRVSNARVADQTSDRRSFHRDDSQMGGSFLDDQSFPHARMPNRAPASPQRNMLASGSGPLNRQVQFDQDLRRGGQSFERLDNGDYPRNLPTFHGRSIRTYRRQIDPETYDGRSDIDDYLDHFEQIADWNQWDDEEKAMQLCMSLRGPAKSVINALSRAERVSYVSVWHMLHQSFGHQNNVSVMQEKFWQRVRGHGESLTEFASDLELLGRSAFAGMVRRHENQAFETMLVNRFVAGIGNFELGRHVHLQRPTSLREAVTCAREYLAYEQIGRRSLGPKPKSPVNMVGDPYSEVQDHKEVMSALKDLKDEIKSVKLETSKIKKIEDQISSNTRAIERLNQNSQPNRGPNPNSFLRGRGGQNNSGGRPNQRGAYAPNYNNRCNSQSSYGYRNNQNNANQNPGSSSGSYGNRYNSQNNYSSPPSQNNQTNQTPGFSSSGYSSSNSYTPPATYNNQNGGNSYNQSYGSQDAYNVQGNAGNSQGTYNAQNTSSSYNDQSGINTLNGQNTTGPVSDTTSQSTGPSIPAPVPTAQQASVPPKLN